LANRTKVNQHQPPIQSAANDVRGLNIAMDNPITVNKLHHRQDFCQKILYLGFGLTAPLANLLGQGLALNVVLDQVELTTGSEVIE